MSKDYDKLIKEARDYQAANPNKPKTRAWYAYNKRATAKLRAVLAKRKAARDSNTASAKEARESALKAARSKKGLTDLQKLNLKRSKQRKKGMAIQTALRKNVMPYEKQQAILYKRRIDKAQQDIDKLNNRYKYDSGRLQKLGAGTGGAGEEQRRAYEKNYLQRLRQLESVKSKIEQDFKNQTVAKTKLDSTGLSISANDKEKRVLEGIRLQQSNPHSYGSRAWYEFNKNANKAKLAALGERSAQRETIAKEAERFAKNQAAIATEGKAKINAALVKKAQTAKAPSKVTAKEEAFFDPFAGSVLRIKEKDGFDDDEAVIKKDMKRKRRKGRRRSKVIRSRSTLRI